MYEYNYYKVGFLKAQYLVLNYMYFSFTSMI